MIFGTILLSATSAQPVLSYNHHALKAGVNNPMSYCDYLEPGPGGNNRTWDFSDLHFNRLFTGYLKNSTMTQTGASFTQSNTELAEFDSRFYFRVDANRVEQYGYSSADGKIQIRYDIPFVKMKFPFCYGNSYSGTFSGTTYCSGTESGSITGTYSVEADAYGTLILPSNTVYESTLRIRTEKSYSSIINQQSQEVHIITYRWYNESHRYPLLVLTEYSVKSGENTTVNHQAAYNNNAIHFISPVVEESALLYPNPTSSYLGLEFTVIAPGTIYFTISDMSGKVLRTFSEDISTGGLHTYDLSDKISGLSPSTYFLSIMNGEEIIQRNFTLIE
jgi:hypothetical protein